jgi:hypothetical protein
MYTFNKKENRTVLSYPLSHLLIPLDNIIHNKSSKDTMMYMSSEKILPAPCFLFASHNIFIQNTSTYIHVFLTFPTNEKGVSGMFREWPQVSVISEQSITLFLYTAHRFCISEVFTVQIPYKKVENRMMIPRKMIPIV